MNKKVLKNVFSQRIGTTVLVQRTIRFYINICSLNKTITKLPIFVLNEYEILYLYNTFLKFSTFHRYFLNTRRKYSFALHGY